jgi:hypothetical protein
MNRRLRVAAVLLFVRAGLLASAGLPLLVVAGVIWAMRPTGGGDSALVGLMVSMLIAGGLAVVGAACLAVAIPSVLVGWLVLRSARRAHWAALVVECLVATALAVATVAALTHSGDAVLAVIPATALVAVSAPAIAMMVSSLRQRRAEHDVVPASRA